VSQFLVTVRTPNPQLLGGKVDRILPQVVHRSTTERRLTAVPRDVKRTLGLEGGFAEAAQSIPGTHTIGPELGNPGGEHSQWAFIRRSHHSPLLA
jgi:hypothetical protein